MGKKHPVSKKELKFLKMIAKLDFDDFKEILPLLKSSHVNLICTVCRNVLFSKLGLKLNKKSIGKIKKHTERHRNSYLQLSNKNLGINKKKQIISQRGGFISTLVGIAIPLISSLVTALSK